MASKPPPFQLKSLRLGKFNILDEKTLKDDIKRLYDVLRYYGYYQGRVLADTDKGGRRLLYKLEQVAPPTPYFRYERVRVKIRVAEGPRATVESLNIKFEDRDRQRVARQQLDKLGLGVASFLKDLPLETKGAFSTPKYKSLKVELLRRLQKRSFAMGKVRGRAFVKVAGSKKGPTALVEIRVRPGPPCIFGKLKISGNKAIPQKLIRTFLEFKPGEKYTLDKILNTRKRLMALEVFEVVNFTPKIQEAEPVGDGRYRIPITLEVKEDKFQTLRFGVGISLDGDRQKLQGNVQYTIHNLFGSLQKLEFQATPGVAWFPDIFNPVNFTPDVLSTLTFTQPIFFGKKRADFDIRMLYNFSTVLGSDEYYHQFRPSVSYLYPFWTGFTSRSSWNFEIAVNVFDPLRLESSSYFLGYLEQSFVLDLRDNPVNTTRGILASVTVQAGALDFLMVKASAELRYYIPLPLDMVLAGRVRYGIMFSSRTDPSDFSFIDDKEELRIAKVQDRTPWTQRFFSGGPNNVRGWNTRFLGPLVCQRRGQIYRYAYNRNGERVRVLVQQNSATPRNIAGIQRQGDGRRCHSEAGSVLRSQMSDMAKRYGHLPSEEGRVGASVLPEKRTLQVVPMGGEHIMEASLELRIPFTFLRRLPSYRKVKSSFLYNLSIALFVDAGVVQMEPRIFDEQGQLALDLMPSISVGAGIRYKTVIGTFSLDFAWRLNPDIALYPLQSQWKIHFSISQ
jgi:outer membrane protein assembly factor BamA